VEGEGIKPKNGKRKSRGKVNSKTVNSKNIYSSY
jgi:hypothetical protein